MRLRQGTPEVRELLSDPGFRDALHELARRLDRNGSAILDEASGYLREMAATHGRLAEESWSRLGRWMLRAYDVFVDEDGIGRLRELDRRHPLVLLPSHRSYLDGWVLPNTLTSHGISAPFSLGGANVNFFPLGTIASRSGMIFIRRDTAELPVYRLTLRAFIARLLRSRANLSWSIEGGRTRTGKLRPPRYGLLRYVIDAVGSYEGPDVMIVPVSIVYDQLHEVPLMTSEARGGRKRPEDALWLLRFALQQRERLGRVYLDFGEPLPLSERLAELEVEPAAEAHVVERVALDVCHRINRATAVPATAVVSLALLGADRALTLDQVLATVEPLAAYIAARGYKVAGAADLTDRSTIRRALHELVVSDVLSSYDGGPDAVWGIGAEQHLVAAFYRNTAIHILVNRAIAELALLAAAQVDGDVRQTALAEGLRLRELLKFEFFFAARQQFVDELGAELELLDTGAHPRFAHLVLRPFVDAYHVVADRLADAGGDAVDEAVFLDDCLRLGRQWALQRRLGSEESVSLELFRTALRLARHRGLLDADAEDLERRRREFADEVRETGRRVGAIADMARTGALAG